MIEFAENNFKFHENGRDFSKWVENTVGKGEIVRYEQFLLFPQRFQKRFILQTRNTRDLFGKRLISVNDKSEMQSVGLDLVFILLFRSKINYDKRKIR